jgi:excisionase family DNA binding protein
MSEAQIEERESLMPALLVVPEVADVFGVSRKTVHNWITSGKLPHIRTPGRGIRVKREHIEALLNDGETARNAA